MDMTTIGDRLRERRQARKLSLRAAAKYEGIAHSYLGQLERGENDPNVWNLLVKLARRYGTSTDYLLGLTDDPAPVDKAQSPEFAEDRAQHTITDTQRAVLDLLDQLPEDEQQFVIDLIQFVIERSAPKNIG